MTGSPRRQRGIALITVLLVMVIAVAAVTHSILRNRIAVTRTGALLANTQLAEFVIGAEVWARVALEKDHELDREENPSADSAYDAWAQPALQFNPDNGKIRINIKDLHSCFNVNNLAAGGSGQSGNRQRQVFERLVRNITGKPEIARSIQDWLDEGDTPMAPGTEDDGYLGRELAYRTPDTMISDVSELSAVQGMELEDWRMLQPFLCALPEAGTAINVNFAPAELLEAVDPQANIADILRFRESDGVFSDRSQLGQFGISDSGGLVFHSRYFLARIAVQLGGDDGHRQYWESTLQLDESRGQARVVQRQRRDFSTGMMRELLEYQLEEASQ